MKNLKKLTKKSLKEISGGVAATCPSLFQSCFDWCRWNSWQQANCMLSEPCTLSECFD
ncbi:MULTISPECIES: bacteriocin-like protein [Chryseobacterium]|uniref:bacteriocin-like protein n=1 Tax=Chryseobacterium TaxID=59732 RepID=UPI0011774D67|nr:MULTISPECIES: hypothetical protein [unclassified Chryseobacterium]MBL3548593.1 hypothetical protein [Chryseobacterium sp. KMC2]